jgi:hypothetical protein
MSDVNLESFAALNNLFQVSPEHTAVATTTQPPASASGPTSFSDDSDRIKDILFDTLTKSQTALDDILAVAKGTESARAYEVAGQMVKTIADVTDKVLEIHRTKAVVEKKGTTAPAVNNNLFVGSTHELMRMLNRAQQDEVASVEFEELPNE